MHIYLSVYEPHSEYPHSISIHTS